MLLPGTSEKQTTTTNWSGANNCNAIIIYLFSIHKKKDAIFLVILMKRGYTEEQSFVKSNMKQR